MIHHVSLEVADLERSAAFYDALLTPLGWRRHVESSDVVGWGIVRPVFFASTRRPPGTGGGHICFAANGIPAVKAAFESGVRAGGVADGDPGLRPQYGPNHYAAYLLDPDGYRVEVAVGTG